MLDTSILCRTISTTTTYPETVFDPSINANVLRKDGQLSSIHIIKEDLKRDGRIYRPDTHLYVDTSIVENIYAEYDKEEIEHNYFANDRYEELNRRIRRAIEKFEKYTNNYLTFTANALSTIKISNNGTNKPDIEYCKNNGSWKQLKSSDTISLEVGETMKVRGTNINGFSTSSANYTKFVMTGNITVSGNIMTLIDESNPTEVIKGNYCFYSLFNGCAALTNIENLKLPATTLTEYCYSNMFGGTGIQSSNTNGITKLPNLPASTLTKCCYLYMFANCYYLKDISEFILHATLLAPYCYNGMFARCYEKDSTTNGLTKVSPDMLPATNLLPFCYSQMFRSSLLLENIPNLLAEYLPDGCYFEMAKIVRYDEGGLGNVPHRRNYMKCMAISSEKGGNLLGQSSKTTNTETREWIHEMIDATFDTNYKYDESLNINRIFYANRLANWYYSDSEETRKSVPFKSNCPSWKTIKLPIYIECKVDDTVLLHKEINEYRRLIDSDFTTAPSKEGYVFKGWKMNGTTLHSGDLLPLTWDTWGYLADAIMIADYEKMPIISYSTEHGTAPSSKIVNKGYVLSNADLPTLSEYGYVFNGWNKSIGDIINEDTTITALWTKLPVISYYTEHGITPPEKIVNIGYVLTNDDLPTLTTEGYIFTGWDKSVGDIINSDTLITATWKMICNIEYNSEHGIVPQSKSVPQGYTLVADDLPTLRDAGYNFDTWYLNQELTAKAVVGYEITNNTTLYAKWMAPTLTFKIVNAADNTPLEPADGTTSTTKTIKKLLLKGTKDGVEFTKVIEGQDLIDAYDSTTKYYTIENFESNTVNYSIYTIDDSVYSDELNMNTTYNALNNNAIRMKKKDVIYTLGEVNMYCNWTKINDGRIYDVYTLVYEGEAPLPTEASKQAIKRLELSYGQSCKTGALNPYHLPKNETTNGISVIYNADLDGVGRDWCPGEITSLKFDEGVSLESIFRRYSFVLIVNDYETGKPGTDSPTSDFLNMCPDISYSIEVLGNIRTTKTIPLNLPEGYQETGDHSSNWIVFKTRILGENETINSDLSNLIVEITNEGYTYLDGTNSARTNAYTLTCGGVGYIDN